jgi:glutamate formiminotransferase/formiminotetrahydrofolate cyclodeaminase
METSYQSMEVMEEMASTGLQNSLSDVGVGALCAKTAVIGAYFNVKINARDIKDKAFADSILKQAETIYQKTMAKESQLTTMIFDKLDG